MRRLNEETPASARPSNPLAATWPLLLGMGILMLGAGLQSTEISLRGTLEGFSATVTGAVMSSYYLGYLFGTSAAPSLVRRVGHIRVFAALAAVAAASILLQGLFIEPVRSPRMACGAKRAAHPSRPDKSARSSARILLAVKAGNAQRRRVSTGYPHDDLHVGRDRSRCVCMSRRSKQTDRSD